MRRAHANQWNITHRSRNDPLDQDETPGNNQGLNRVREGVCLVGPGDVGGSEQQHRNSSVSRGLHQLIDRPVFEDKVHDEHENSERPEDGDRWNFAIVALPYPQPAEKEHG